MCFESLSKSPVFKTIDVSCSQSSEEDLVKGHLGWPQCPGLNPAAQFLPPPLCSEHLFTCNHSHLAIFRTFKLCLAIRSLLPLVTSRVEIQAAVELSQKGVAGGFVVVGMSDRYILQKENPQGILCLRRQTDVGISSTC